MIQFHDPSIWEDENSSCLRPCCCCDRPLYLMYLLSVALEPIVGSLSLCSFLILYAVGRTPWKGISPSQDLCLHTGQHKHRITHIYIHTSSGIRTHDLIVLAGEDSSCLIISGVHVRKSLTIDVTAVTVSLRHTMGGEMLGFQVYGNCPNSW
jgi:hypothetical protein